MEVYDVVIKLIGPIEPIGETNADEKRFENLKAMIGLIDRLLSAVDSVAAHRDRQEYSMQRAGKVADKFFAELRATE